MVAQSDTHSGAEPIGISPFRIEADCLVEIHQCKAQVTARAVDKPPIEIGEGMARIELDGLFEVSQRATGIAFPPVDGTAAAEGVGVCRCEADGVAVICMKRNQPSAAASVSRAGAAMSCTVWPSTSPEPPL